VTAPPGNVERTWVAFESETARRYRFGSYANQGVYHHLAGTHPTVAFIATHHVVDFTDHYMARPLAERGFGFLGWNTRYRGNDAYFDLDNALVEQLRWRLVDGDVSGTVERSRRPVRVGELAPRAA
jgi:hypothetical protein